jgi:hypothetical protein
VQRIIVTVDNDGEILVEGVPPGIEVELRDYDAVQEHEDEELLIDEAGRRYVSAVFTNED